MHWKHVRYSLHVVAPRGHDAFAPYIQLNPPGVLDAAPEHSPFRLDQHDPFASPGVQLRVLSLQPHAGSAAHWAQSMYCEHSSPGDGQIVARQFAQVPLQLNEDVFIRQSFPSLFHPQSGSAMQPLHVRCCEHVSGTGVAVKGGGVVVGGNAVASPDALESCPGGETVAGGVAFEHGPTWQLRFA